MKRIICALLCVCLLAAVVVIATPAVIADTHEPFSQTAIQFLDGISAGWNLGNTFEAYSIWGKTLPANYTPNDLETGWGNPKTTQAMFDAVYEQGFNAVRIPCSWGLFVDDNNNYKIRDDYMARVKEVVGYAQKHDMYIILNMHHDDKYWLDISRIDSEWDKIVIKYKAIWAQIATAFKDYDEKLILESNNEIVNGSDWWGTDADFVRINALYKEFYDTVRASGGNNDKRYLMFPTYGAQWYEHQFGAVRIPNNDNHCIIDIHWYSTTTTQAAAEKYMVPIYEKLIAKGTAVVLGECGIRADATENTKKLWATYYYGVAKQNGLRCFIWDDGGNYKVLERSTCDWVSDTLVDTIISTVNGTEPTTAAPTTPKPSTSGVAPTEPVTPPTNKTVLYNFSLANHFYSKTEGWYDNSWWGQGVAIYTAYKNGSITISTETDETYSQTEYNQTNCVYKNVPASSKQVFVDVTNNTKNSVRVKIFMPGYTPPADELLPVAEPGKTITVLLGAVNGGSITFQIMHNNNGLIAAGENQFVISPLYTASDNTTVTGKPLTTAAPTSAAPTTTQPAAPTTLKPNFPTTTKPTIPTTTRPTIPITTNPTVPTTAKPTVPTTTIISIMFGDVNSDNAVNAKDVLRLKQHLAGWPTAQINRPASDVNADGGVNAKDLLKLMQYLANWPDIVLGQK